MPIFPAVAGLIVVALGMLTVSTPKATHAAELPSVEVGLPSGGLFGLGGRYILDKGLDRKSGFVLKPRWAGVAQIQRLLAVKAIPVGLATPESALRANLKGVPIRLIQPYQVPHNYVLVRKDSPYKAIEDLKGKSVALTREVTALYNLFDYIMKKRGVNIEKEFQLKKLGAAGIRAVLEKGDVEAAIIWEAHVSSLLATGKYRTIMSFRKEMARLLNTKTYLFSWLGALAPWVEKNPKLVSKIRAAWQEGIRGVQEDEAHFRKYAKKMFGLEGSDVVSLGWKRTRAVLLPPNFKWPEKTSLEMAKRYLKEGIELGIFPKEGTTVIDKMFAP
jgi:ABC-type nitrate/sulfonate/bicarbonate transport system substrate-binding protein